MTNGEFIQSQLRAYNIEEADLMIIRNDIDLDGELDEDAAEVAMLPLLVKALLAPMQKSVSEHGLSVTWDTDKVGWWYLWLCRKHKVKPDDEVLSAIGISTIIDRTAKW